MAVVLMMIDLKSSLAASTLLLLTVSPAFADLTENQALEHGLANPHIQEKLAAQLNAAQGRVDATGNWANPEIEYSREEIDLLNGTGEETSLWLRQEINIAGVPGLHKRSAQLARDAEGFRVVLARREWQRGVREAFYQTLAAQSLTAILGQYRERLGAIAHSVEQRVARGDASRFDARRIQQELATLNSRYQSAISQRDAQQARLFNRLDQTPEPLVGELSPPASATDAVFSVEDHPLMQALATEQRSAATQAQAARREAWPTVTLGVGRKQIDEPQFDTDGEMVMLGVEIPLFRRGNGDAQVAESEARRLRADAALLRQQLLTDYRAAQQSYQSQRDSAIAIRQLLDNDQGTISEIAEASYRAGELSVLELLDAYRSDLASHEQYLQTALQARLSYIQLQFLRGE